MSPTKGITVTSSQPPCSSPSNPPPRFLGKDLTTSLFSLLLSVSTSTPQKRMRFINPNRTLPFSFLLSLIILSVASPASASIHDLLRSQGLPPGLLPKEVRSYTLSADGRLEIFLDGPCLTKFENLVYYDSVVKANLTYASLTGVVGLSQEELFLWLPVKDIIVSDPDSGLILFDIGVAHKQLSLSLFEDPPRCRSPQQGILVNHVTKEKNGFEALRR